MVEDLLEDGTVGEGAAGGLGEHPVAAGLRKRVDLEVWLLVGGGDPCVAKEVADAPRVAQPCDSAACATLVADTNCGRIFTVQRQGRGGCRRNDRFRNSSPVHRT